MDDPEYNSCFNSIRYMKDAVDAPEILDVNQEFVLLDRQKVYYE